MNLGASFMLSSNVILADFSSPLGAVTSTSHRAVTKIKWDHINTAVTCSELNKIKLNYFIPKQNKPHIWFPWKLKLCSLCFHTDSNASEKLSV